MNPRTVAAPVNRPASHPSTQFLKQVCSELEAVIEVKIFKIISTSEACLEQILKKDNDDAMYFSHLISIKCEEMRFC